MIVHAMFDNALAANQAVAALEENGFKRDRMSVLVTDATRQRYFVPAHGDNMPEGAATGGAIGAIAGGLTALGAFAVPGGIFVVGPFLAILGGVSLGAAGGGLVGALIGLGIPQTEARVFEREIKAGGILVGVETHDTARAALAGRLMSQAGARRIRNTAGPASTSASAHA